MDCAPTPFNRSACAGGWADLALDWISTGGITNLTSYPYTGQGKIFSLCFFLYIDMCIDQYTCLWNMYVLEEKVNKEEKKLCVQNMPGLLQFYSIRMKIR